jgi:hypothetical protein
MQPGGVDQYPAPQSSRVGAGDREFEAAVPDPPQQHHGVQHDDRTRGLGVALEGEHQRVAVDDPGRWRKQRGGAAQRRFETPGRSGAQPFEVVDAIASRARRDRLEPGEFGLVGGDDQFPEPGMRYAALAAIGVEALAAGNTALRLEAALRIIDPAMDHLAVA